MKIVHTVKALRLHLAALKKKYPNPTIYTKKEKAFLKVPKHNKLLQNEYYRFKRAMFKAMPKDRWISEEALFKKTDALLNSQHRGSMKNTPTTTNKGDHA